MPSASCKSGLSAHASIFLRKNTGSARRLDSNARAYARATTLQNHEALLRDFGLNNHFPIVGKWLLSHSFAHIKGKNARRIFYLNYISPLIILGREILRAGADYLPQPLPQADGAFCVRELYFRVVRSYGRFYSD